jgi:hypothetical protein
MANSNPSNLIAGSGITLTPSSSGLTVASSGGSGINTIAVQTFSANGTYTPTSGMVYCIVKIVAGGGGSGGVSTVNSSQISLSEPGGGGEYAEGIFSAATIGASQAVTIGAAGAAGAAGNNAGSTGGTTSLGALITAIGGDGGAGDIARSSNSNYAAPANNAGGTGGTGGYFRMQGGSALQPVWLGSSWGTNFQGGSSPFSSVNSANSYIGYGGGGAAKFVYNTSQEAGVAGQGGFMIITEFCA